MRRGPDVTGYWISRRAQMDAAFFDKADKSGGPDACWPWRGARRAKGYGFFIRFGRSIQASRRSLEIALGRSLRPGECALHHCDNPPCVNPSHLFIGTIADNNHDAKTKGRSARGQKAGPRSGLTEAIVLAIRESTDSTANLARRYGINEGTMRDARRGKTWGWLATDSAERKSLLDPTLQRPGR
jgi:hypothetical protein